MTGSGLCDNLELTVDVKSVIWQIRIYLNARYSSILHRKLTKFDL